MCGIAGIFSARAPVEEGDLRRLTDPIRHRGPDDQGFYRHDRLGLAQTRLSIIDLEGGHQPLLDRSRQTALVANGEIYNYIELREQLRTKGADFLTRSDSETILHAWRHLGGDYLSALRGMFAFALYDVASGKLHLARDRIGIKPLYYTLDNDRLLFNSEIKGLLNALDRQPEINPGALLQFLQNQFNTGRETIFKGIHRVLPGETLVVDADLGLHHRRYWSALDIQPRDIGFEEAAAEFDALFDRAMTEHMRSDVPFGLFLSGGVDSAILAAALRRLHHHPIRSFSVGFANASIADELDDAQRIAKLVGTEHQALKLDQRAIFNRFAHTVWAADDLMRDYACLPTSILSQQAAQSLKVIFSGEGGDEVFAGYGRYRKTRLERRLKTLFAPGSGGFRTRGQWKPRWARALMGERLRQARDQQRAPFIETWRSTPRNWSDLQRSQYTDLVTAMPDNLLVKADRMMMSFGLEGRVPFLDHRIVEFGLSLPDALKVQSRQGKVFLKRWAEGFLPEDHLWRKKKGFHVPLGEWLTSDFLSSLEKKLPRNPAIREWFNADAVAQLLASQKKRGDASREIWSLMQFATWHRLFIEGNGAEPPPDSDPLQWL